ncbi:tetratricopeptide repeat protein [Sulfurimonas sp.]
MKLKHITQSILPVIALLSTIFFVLLLVQYKAMQKSDRAKYIYISANENVNTNINENEIFENDYSENPIVLKANDLLQKKKFNKAENLYYQLLSNQTSPQIYNLLGILYLKQKLDNKALVAFSNALKLDPGYYKARYNRALIYSSIKKYKDAEADYKKILSSFNAHSKTHLNLGLLYYKTKRYNLAIQEFLETIKLSSGEKKIKAYYLLAKSYSKITPPQKTKAIEAYKELIRLNPAHINAHIALALLENNDAMQQIGALKKLLNLSNNALSVYKAMIKIYKQKNQQALILQTIKNAMLNHPNNIKFKLELIEILLKTKNNADAKNQLLSLLEIDKKNTQALFLLAKTYSNLQEYEKSLEIYKNILKIQNKNISAEVLYNLGLLYNKMQRYPEAKESYLSAIEKKHDYAEAYYRLAQLSLKIKNKNEAIKHLTKAIELKRNYISAYKALAKIYSNDGEYLEAIELYKRVLSFAPRNIKIKLSLANKYAKIKNYTKAKEIYEEILQKDKSYFLAWLNLGLAEYNLKEYDSAKKSLMHALELKNDANKAYRILAKVYIASQEYNEAIDILMKLLDQDPSDVKARLYYANSLYKTNEYDKAIKEYKKILALNPNNQKAKTMIEQLQLTIKDK